MFRDLVQALLAAACPAPIERHPFVRAVAAGTLSRDALKRYALDVMAGAKAFPRRLAEVLALCDDADVRRWLLGNLLEEEGAVAFVPIEGVRIREERCHGMMAEKFARGAGATDEELKAAERRPPLWSEAMRNGDWLSAFSYFAVGHEANVPRTFRALTGPLVERYGLTLDDLEFLTEHFEADQRHGQESARLIARVATTEDARARALDGARRGGIAWWTFHRGRTAAAA